MLTNTMTSKFVYLTTSEIGTIAQHDFGETFDFESEPHEMRLHELIYNSYESLLIGPEKVLMLWIIPDDKGDETTMKNVRDSVIGHAVLAGRTCGFIESFTGYSNILFEEVSERIKPTYLSDFREILQRGQTNAFPVTRFNAVQDLIEKINYFLSHVSPRWSREDSVPKLYDFQDQIHIIPGEILLNDKRKISLIPVFGSSIARILSLPEFPSEELMNNVKQFTQGKQVSMKGGIIDKDPFLDHFYIMRCNICQNKDGDPDDSGTVFSWLKDPSNVSKICHVRNKSDCWIPVEKKKIHDMQIIIRTSTGAPLAFTDDYTLAVFEFRPTVWKEQST